MIVVSNFEPRLRAPELCHTILSSSTPPIPEAAFPVHLIASRVNQTLKLKFETWDAEVLG